MSIFYLSYGDFHIQQGTNSPLLCHGMNHISMIMFHSTQSSYSQQIAPIFKMLPQAIRGCQFGIINIGQHMNLVQMAAQTNTPIEYVPLIIMYVNGIPYMEYKGPADLENMRQFIITQYNAIEKQISFTNQDNTSVYSHQATQQQNVYYDHTKKRIPQFSLGSPLYGDDMRQYLHTQEGLMDLGRGRY